MDVFSFVHNVLAAFGDGELVLIIDDDRELEGDLAIAAEHVTPAAINFLTKMARGLICVPLVGQRLDDLHIPMMVATIRPESAAFTVSVDARSGVSSGISAHDRAHTIRVLIDRATRPADLVSPGHVFPLRCADGGVLCRHGHTEASVDLARLAGLYPAAVISEVLNEDGTMADPVQLSEFANRHRIPSITIGQIVEYRQRTEAHVPPRFQFGARARPLNGAPMDKRLLFG